jgi:hypothetical protein
MVAPTITQRAVLTNTVQIGTTTPESNAANNSATATNELVQRARQYLPLVMR